MSRRSGARTRGNQPLRGSDFEYAQLPGTPKAFKKKGRGWNPGGSAVHPGVRAFMIFIFGFGVPFFFFLGYFIAHKSIDESALAVRMSEDEDDRGDQRDDLDTIKKLWQKFSIRQRMMMICLSMVLWLIGGKMVFIWEAWYKLVALIMIVTGAISIIWDQGRGNAFIYFRDNIWPGGSKGSYEEMKQTCKEFGCGYLPHNNVESNVACSEDNRGDDVKDY